MKNVVILDELHELGVRPKHLFDAYISLLKTDIKELLGDVSKFVEVPCPACAGRDRRPAFEKCSFRFVRCLGCSSLFVSPRPTQAMLRRYYSVAGSFKFWQEQFSKDTEQERDERIFQPRVSWILDNVLTHCGRNGTIVDIESKYSRLLREITQSNALSGRFTLQPLVDITQDTGFSLAPAGRQLTADAVLLMEVLERSFDPLALVEQAEDLLAEGGLLFITTTAGSGFDLQVLGARSKNLLPPTHLNLLSVEGISGLLTSKGFQILELSTPGQLDAEIVANALKEDPAIPLPPVISDLILKRDGAIHQAFQEFLQRARLSSHLRLVARKGNAR